jgi:iron(III) transport system substrate-binding protein
VVGGGLSAVCMQGAKEGSFSYWASDPASDFQQIYAKFSAKYPGIKVNYLSLNSDDAVPRILTALAAGKSPGVDLLNGDIVTFEPLANRGLINQKVQWTSLGIPAAFVGGPNIVVSYRQHFGIAYNPDKIKASALPSTWAGLINPKWKGQVIVDPRGYPFMELAATWGAAKTIAYMKQLNSVVHPIVVEGGTSSMTDVSRGEALIGTLGIADSVPGLQAAGTPIAVKFLDVVPSIGDWSLLLKGAKHPNAAACYVGWLATAAGQSAIKTVLSKTNTDEPPGVPASVPDSYPATRAQVNAANQVGAEAAALWGTSS